MPAGMQLLVDSCVH